MPRSVIISYEDLDDLPEITDGTNNAELKGTIEVSATSGSVAGVNIDTNTPGTIGLEFTLPKGADGQNGAPGHNPCLGRFNVLPTLSPNPFADARKGDYIYFDTTDQQTSDPVTYIYYFDGTDWDTTGTLVDVSNLSFSSGQDVTGVAIKDLDGNDDPNATSVPSEDAAISLKNRITGVENKFTHTEYEWELFPASSIESTTKNINSNGNWTIQYDAEIIEITPGEHIGIYVDSSLQSPTTGVYAVLKSFYVDGNPPSNGTTADFSEADGFTDRLLSSENVEFVVPSDGHYLYHSKESSAGYNNSVVKSLVATTVEGIDTDVEELQTKVADIPMMNVDLYGGTIVESQQAVDMTYANLTLQKGYLQSTRWFAGGSKSAIVYPQNYANVKVTGGVGGSTIIFCKAELPANLSSSIDEATMKATYYVTGKRNGSVFSISAGTTEIIPIPENTVVIYVNRVGTTAASDYVPAAFVLVDAYNGADVIRRLDRVEKKTSGAVPQDTYFGSNVISLNITEAVGNDLLSLDMQSGHDAPQSLQHKNVQNKAKEFCLIQWTCKGNIPYRGDTSNPESPEEESGGAYSQGTTITGLPYSSVKEIDKYIGFDVSVLTFMTAVNNPYSLLYTENVSEDNSKSDWGFNYHGVNCATYYGTVCSEFSSYCVGMSNVMATGLHEWLSKYAMKAVRLYYQHEDNLRIGDILVRYKRSTMSSMHCMVVVDITRDGNGHVTGFKVAESTGSHVRYSSRTKIADSNTENLVIAYRFTEIYKNIGYTDTASEFIDLSLLPNPTYSTTSDTATIAAAQKSYVYNNDICTFAGDKACFGEGELVVLNYNLSNDVNWAYTGIEVYKDDVLINTYNIADISQIGLPQGQTDHALKLGTALAAGEYKARCVGTGINSEYTYWEVIETSVTKTYDAEEHLTTIEFSSDNGHACCLGLANLQGSQLSMRNLTEDEVSNGKIVTNLEKLYNEQNGKNFEDIEGDVYIKLYFQGKYGRTRVVMSYVDEE